MLKKLFNLKSIRSRLIASFVVMTLLALVLGVNTVITGNKLRQVVEIRDKFAQLKEEVLTMRSLTVEFILREQNNEDFMQSGQSPYINQYNESLRNVKIALMDLAHTDLENQQVLGSIRKEVDRVDMYFGEVAKALKQRGAGSYGIIGQFTESMQQLTNYDFGISSKADLNNIRVLEREYIQKTSPENLDELKNAIFEFAIAIDGNLTDDEVEQVSRLIENYETSVVKLVDIDSSLGRTPAEGIQAELFKGLNNVEAFVTETDEQINEQSASIIANVLIVSISLIVLAILVGLVISWTVPRSIVEPIYGLRDAILVLAEGKLLKDKNQVETTGELSQIAKAVKVLDNNLTNVKNFAQEVGSGNFNTNINVFDDQGDLGESLATMRESLKKVDEEEKQRNKIAGGVARFNDLLRNFRSADIDALSKDLLKALIEETNSCHGAFYVYDEEQELLILTAAYAEGRLRFVKHEYKPGEGLPGECFEEQGKIILDKLPQDYGYIELGLGKAKPQSVMLIPLSYNEVTNGVIELASFGLFSEAEIDIAERVSEGISSSISTIQTAKRTDLLLNNAKERTEQLNAQEEAMRQNMEELNATQEEMSRKTDELETIMNAVNTSNAMVEFTPEGYVTGANSMFLSTMGYTFREIKGVHHKIFCLPEYAESLEYKSFWENLRRGKSESNLVERVTKGGDIVFLQANYNPIRDSKGKLVKIIKLAQDVTKSTEENFLRKAQLTAMNKSAAVVEFDMKSRITYANDNFLATVGYTLEELKGREHSMLVPDEIRQSEEYTLFWERLRQGLSHQGTYKRLHKDGSLVYLQAAYSPVFNYEGIPYKVFKLAYDVTEQELIKNELQQTTEEIRSQEEELRQTVEEMSIIQESMAEREAEAAREIDSLRKALEAYQKDEQGDDETQA